MSFQAIIYLCAHISAPVTDMVLTLTTPTTVTSTEPFKPANLTPLNWFEKRPHFATAAATSEQESNTIQGEMYDGAIPIHINRIDPVSDAKFHKTKFSTPLVHVKAPNQKCHL